MAFAKVDSGLHRNHKIVRAGPDAREVFVLLLCLNAELDADGRLSAGYLDPDYLAVQLQRDRNACVTGVTACIEHRLIARLRDGDDEFVVLVGWNDAWSKKPRSNAERQASWRDRNRVTDRNDVSVTNNANNASEKIREDQRRGDISEPAPRRARKRPAVPLPADWTPKGDAPPRELERFRLHAQANDRRCVDWNAAWRMWLSKAADFNRAGPKAMTPLEAQMARVAELEAEEAGGAG